MKTLIRTTAAMLLLWATPAMADPLSGGMPPEENPFMNASPLGDDELARHRGGFLTPGGLQMDFVLTSRTLIDGTLRRDVTFNSDSLRSIDINDLMQVIQIGPQNQLAELEALQNDPAVLTLIQNSLDDSVIQNLSILDITVHNFSQFEGNHALNNLSPVAGLR